MARQSPAGLQHLFLVSLMDEPLLTMVSLIVEVSSWRNHYIYLPRHCQMVCQGVSRCKSSQHFIILKSISVVLVLLDLSAEFDKVDHDVLFAWLKNYLVYQVLYLSGFCHIWKNIPKECQYRVPYGMLYACCVVFHSFNSWPSYFNIWLLGITARWFGVGCHFYADNTQLCVSQDHGSESKVSDHWRIWNIALQTFGYGLPKIC